MRRSEFAAHVLIVVVGLLCLSMLFDRGRNSLLDITVFFGFFVGLGLLGQQRQRRGRAIIASHSGESDPTMIQAAIARLQKEWEWLLHVPHPREIQLTPKGRNHLIRGIFGIGVVNVMLALCVLGNWWVFQKEHGPLAERLIRPILIFCAVLGAIYTLLSCGLLIRYHTRARRLLVHGQVVIGKADSLAESSFTRLLNIDFLHPSGENVKTKWYGASAACFEGMTVPVFCNPLKPKDSFVFLEGGDYEIIRPGLFNTSALSL